MTIDQALGLLWQHRSAGRLSEAESLCRQILGVQPGQADALHILGTIALEVGQPQAAIDLIQQAINSNPNVADYHTNLSAALGTLGQFEAAAAACRCAIRLQPGNAMAHYNLGKAEEDSRRLEAAIASYRQAVALNPNYPEAHDSLGTLLSELGRFEEAINAFRAAIRANPNFATAYNNLGNALNESGQSDAAIDAFQSALHLQPQNALAINNLASTLKDVGRLDEALMCFRRAIAARPDDAAIHSNFVYAGLFDPRRDHVALHGDGAEWARAHAASLAQCIQPHRNVADPHRRLRIGYVSPDFCQHVICHFLVPLLEAHDRSVFEIFCYASVKIPDATTARLRATVDMWRDVLALGDESLAVQIREDGIDILVDLTQHMAANRLPLFARKPAPVQVAWLGFPGSTGLRAIDYRFTDARLEPLGAPWAETVEEPVRLPHSWFCFDPLMEYPAIGKLPALTQSLVTFGCLNNFAKVSNEVLALWVQVLSAVPGARLLLQCPAGSTQIRVREFFVQRGIDHGRLELVSRFANRGEFLNLFARIDIALDPFPYNGGTTTCEALWMGLPVLTLPGKQIVSRIGLSILTAVGLPELVADSEADFVSRATALAADLPRLAEMRTTLRERMKASPFMDASRFARAVEGAYRMMWEKWCARSPSSCSTQISE